jgi:hypothetical protein
MNSIENFSQIQHIVQEIDRLIDEMSSLRSEVAVLGSSLAQTNRSVRKAEYFGMWADREDMHGQSSRAWLEQMRTQQWIRQ